MDRSVNRWPRWRAALALGSLGLLLASCVFDTSGVPPEGALDCGNGVVDGAEYCDGDDLGGRDCANLMLGGGILACNPNCTFNTSGCEKMAHCGNGLVEGGEQCDDGNTANGDGCDNLCQVEGDNPCGNGTLDPGEQCDDGNQRNDDDCLTNCRIASCGDGYVHALDEVCEPGTVPTTCEMLGYVSGDLACRPDCQGFDTTNCLRADGQDCVAPFQCQGGECLKEDTLGWPGGLCTRDCGGTGTCPSGFECLNLEGVGDRCFPKCDEPSDCRTGYGCFDPTGVNLPICYPHCENDAECTVTNDCNEFLNRCAQQSAGTGTYGAECDSRLDCQGWCWDGILGGYCASRCKLSTGKCPGGSTCANVWGGDHVDEGLCMWRCSHSFGDCALGYSCEYAYDAEVCLPW